MNYIQTTIAKKVVDNAESFSPNAEADNLADVTTFQVNEDEEL